MAKAIETGIPKMRIEEAAARRQARIDSGKETIVGVNKYKPADEKPLDVLIVDNQAVREAQLKRLAETKAGRDQAAVEAALQALTRIFHGVSTASAQSGMSTALRLFGLLDIFSNMPASPSLRAPCIHARLRRLATKSHEISGLAALRRQ